MRAPRDGIEVAGLVAGRDERRAHGVHEAGIPLRAEAGAALPLGARHGRVAAQVLGDHEPAREAVGRLGIDGRHELPAVCDAVRRRPTRPR